MDKWEYTWYVFNWYKNEIRLSDGRKMNWGQLIDHFDKIGREGWEMITASPIAEASFGNPAGDTQYIIFIFKRRVP